MVQSNSFQKYSSLQGEFLRYVLVGGFAFLLDFACVFFCKEFLLQGLGAWSLYLSTAVGFVVGLIFNFLLSCLFVFRNGRERVKGKQMRAFLVFTIVGLIGLLITEAGMFVGVQRLGFHYLLTKMMVAGVVLVWNYIARKRLIFHQ